MLDLLGSDRPRGRVLYVDDERANLTVFEAAYEDDYEVHTAASAREAIAVLRAHPVDVVITDQRMPQMTGVQFLEAIQSDYPGAIRMILTGFSDIEAIIQAINTGRVDLYLTKPYDVAAMKVTIDRALELRDIESRNRGLVGALERAIEREKRVRMEFQSYVPEAVVRAVLHGDGIARAMKGEARIVTVAFARILDFRRLAAALGSEKVFGLLGAYYDVMNRVIRRHKGLLAEMIADEVLAVFGAPVSSLANEANAVAAAREMVEAVRVFESEQRALLGGERFRLGIGIHRGEVIAGNIGSEMRMKYGVIGDPVNVASRIQDQVRGSEDEILLSAAVKAWLEDDVPLEALGPTSLRGKSQPIELFRLSATEPEPA
jgi:adenylate cyclase